MRKPRSDSKLEALTPDQKHTLCEWLLSAMGYDKVKQLIKTEFGIITSNAALSGFYQSYVGSAVLAHRRRAVGLADEIGADMEKTPGKFDQVTIDALKQKAFELAQNPLVNAQDVKAIFSLVLQARDQSLKEQDIAIKLRRLELLEKSTEKARATAQDSKLSDAEKAARIREIFAK